MCFSKYGGEIAHGDSIHGIGNGYKWGDAPIHITRLNIEHCDWRAHAVKELQSIVNFQNSPAVSSKFNTNCTPCATVLDGISRQLHIGLVVQSTRGSFGNVCGL